MGVLGAAGLGAPVLAGLLDPDPALARTQSTTPVKHVIVACQENRTFDTYFGYYAGAQASGYGVPSGYTQPDGNGGTVAPYHLRSQLTQDPTHDWQHIHGEWDGGQMDGFYTTDGKIALGYYDASDLGYYYALADAFTLYGNYFCSVLGPTYPNRLYLCSGTSGGNTGNNIAGGSLTWPTVVDLLDAYGITWKCYNIGGLGGSPSAPGGDNALVLFKRWQHDRRLYATEADYRRDLRRGTLPQVSFIIPGAVVSEHAPAPIGLGQQTMARVITALISSSAWPRAALVLTYDEGGGFFDHVSPPQFDAYGAGMRVPMVVVSPYARRGYISGAQCEHSSVLKFVEATFGLPTLASVNHRFDERTPAKNNDAANGPFGPPAPPRDRLPLAQVGDLSDAFDFGQNPYYYPRLPSAGAAR
jgi:phospholipase C